MTELREQANRAAQDALRAMHDYRIDHGTFSPQLDAAYSAAERMCEAIEEYERLAGLAHDAAEDAVFTPGPFFLPDVPLAYPIDGESHDPAPDGVDYVGLLGFLEDPGDHFAGMPR